MWGVLVSSVREFALGLAGGRRAALFYVDLDANDALRFSLDVRGGGVGPVDGVAESLARVDGRDGDGCRRY